MEGVMEIIMILDKAATKLRCFMLYLMANAKIYMHTSIHFVKTFKLSNKLVKGLIEKRSLAAVFM